MRNEVDLEEQNDPSHHALEENKFDREWWRRGLLNYLTDSWPPRPRHCSCTIFRVPNQLRECDCKAYEPTFVAIGLFHFGKGESLSPRLQKHKSDCVSYLLARHGSKEKAKKLLQKCMNLALTLQPRARNCYSENVGYVRRHEFAEMLLEDGCFILHLLLKLKKGESPEVDDAANTSELKSLEDAITVAPTIGALWIWDQVVYDLIKLENQIPFFVLQELFDLLRTPADEDIDLVELALELFRGIYPARAKTFKPPPPSDVLHLLHLFHSSLIPHKLKSVTPTEPRDFIPSATVLQDAGIEFRPRDKSTVDSFFEVTFGDGVMEMPLLVLEDASSSILRNLIAFEQCYPNIKTPISNYARLMDVLINTTRDIRLLSLNGVLMNLLGTEEAAFDLFNKLGYQVYCSPNKNYLWKVYTDVTEYYDTPWHKWRAALYYKYFQNPWAIISVLVAGVLLLLTVEQAAFAGLSYIHQSKN